MTRSDLIAALASRFPHLVAKDSEISVKVILDAIGQSLANGDRVEIRGFGSFDLNYRPARPPRQNSCRPDRIDEQGAMMEERIGSIRTGIQG